MCPDFKDNVLKWLKDILQNNFYNLIYFTLLLSYNYIFFIDFCSLIEVKMFSIFLLKYDWNL